MTVSDLKPFEPSLRQCRASIPILVIDDTDFPHTTALKSLGFQIVWRRDIEALSDATPYPIVASDIAGVGSSMGSDGAFLIDQLKRHDPSKYVIAFSSGTYDMRYQATLSAADARVLKGADIETWSHELDRGLIHLCSPAQVWQRAVRKLTDSDIQFQKIAKLEKIFIARLRKGAPLTEFDVKEALEVRSGEAWSAALRGVRELIGFSANAVTIATSES